jgi:hypothetical protein
MVLIVVKYRYFQIVFHVEVNADTYSWDLVVIISANGSVIMICVSTKV